MRSVAHASVHPGTESRGALPRARVHGGLFLGALAVGWDGTRHRGKFERLNLTGISAYARRPRVAGRHPLPVRLHGQPTPSRPQRREVTVVLGLILIFGLVNVSVVTRPHEKSHSFEA